AAAIRGGTCVPPTARPPDVRPCRRVWVRRAVTRGRAPSSPITRREQRLRPRSSDRLVDDVAVSEEDDPVRPGGEVRFVRYDDTGDAPLRRVAEQTHDTFPVHGIQRTGRLVGEQ